MMILEKKPVGWVFIEVYTFRYKPTTVGRNAHPTKKGTL